MTRSVGRLNEVVHSLNARTVSIYSMVNLQAASSRIVNGHWVDPTLRRALGIIADNDKSPHVRDLAEDTIAIIEQKGLTTHAQRPHTHVGV